jgi:hypothetical protein
VTGFLAVPGLRGYRRPMGSAAVALLDAITDGGEYRIHSSNRSPWNGTAHRAEGRRVTLTWHGATPLQDRRLELAIDGDRVVVRDKPNWGHLVKLTPRGLTGERRDGQRHRGSGIALIPTEIRSWPAPLPSRALRPIPKHSLLPTDGRS